MPRHSCLAFTALFSILQLACLGSSVPDSLTHSPSLSSTYSDRTSLPSWTTSTSRSTFITISTASTSSPHLSPPSPLPSTSSPLSTALTTTTIELAIPSSTPQPTESGYFTNSAGDLLADWITQIPTSTLQAAQWTVSLSLAEGITQIATVTGSATWAKQAVATGTGTMTTGVIQSASASAAGGLVSSGAAAGRSGQGKVGLLAAVVGGLVGALVLGT